MNGHKPVSIYHPTEIHLLGIPHLIYPTGERVDFQIDNLLLLIAYLSANAGKSFQRAELAPIFYPDLDDAHANQNMRQTVCRLRKLLGDADQEIPALLVDATSIRINPQGIVITDFGQFNDLYSSFEIASQHHSHRRLEICRSCMDLLESMVKIYTGNFLGGYFTASGTVLDEWIVQVRQTIVERLIQVLHILAQFHFEHRHFSQAETYIDQILTHDSVDEKALRLKMKLLSASGHSNQAILECIKFQQNLQNQYDTELERETLLLAHQIRRREERSSDPFVANHYLPNLPSDIPDTSIPDTTLPFYDRVGELTQITEWFERKDHRVIVLEGMAGSGKTRLALQFAAMEKGAWKDGIWMVFANKGIIGTRSLISAMVQTFNIPSAQSFLHRKDVLKFLGNKECLLIIDDVDDSPDQIEVISSLVDQCQNIQVLITTRKKLAIRKQKTISLGGLAYPALFSQPGNLSSDALYTYIQEHSALQLFFESAMRIAPTFKRDAEHLTLVIEICNMLMGLPLAIETIAAYTRFFTCPEIRDSLVDYLNGVTSLFDLFSPSRTDTSSSLSKTSVNQLLEIIKQDSYRYPASSSSGQVEVLNTEKVQSYA